MNLFPIELDPSTGKPCPRRSAKYVADEHFKIILEAVQMMMTAYRMLYGETKGIKSDHDHSWMEPLMIFCRQAWKKMGHSVVEIAKRSPPKITHAMHPMSIWVRRTPQNFRWTGQYAQELCRERMRRPLLSGKHSAPHQYEPYIEWMLAHPPSFLKFKRFGLTTMPLCMPDEFTSDNGKRLSVVEAYRRWVNEKYNTYLSNGVRRKIDWRRTPHRKPDYIFDYE